MKPTAKFSMSCCSRLPSAGSALLSLSRWGSAVLGGGVLLLGCGAVAETEMFTESTEALSEHVGESCESFPIQDSSQSEVDVDDNHPSCEPGYCVTRGGDPGASEGEGVCTCRCDGPAGTGPFCSCGEGFSCDHLIDDLGLGNLDLAGSYCMPN